MGKMVAWRNGGIEKQEASDEKNNDEMLPPAVQVDPSSEVLGISLSTLLAGRDLTSISFKGFRQELELYLGIRVGGLDHRRDEIRKLVQKYARC